MKAIDVEEFAQICLDIEKDQKGQGNYANALFISELRKMISTFPTVDAVPLDKLCEWMADNVYLKDDTEAAWELNPDSWKKLLTKWMEEQDAKEKT